MSDEPEDLFLNLCSRKVFKQTALDTCEVWGPSGFVALIGINPYTGKKLVWTETGEVTRLDTSDEDTTAYWWIATTMSRMTTEKRDVRLFAVCKLKGGTWCMAVVCTTNKPGIYHVSLMDQRPGEENGTLHCMAYFGNEREVKREKNRFFKNHHPLNFTFCGRAESGQSVRTSFSVSSQALKMASEQTRRALEFFCQNLVSSEFWRSRLWDKPGKDIYSFQCDTELGHNVMIVPHQWPERYEELIPFNPILSPSDEPPLPPPVEEKAQASSSSSSPEPATEEEAQAASSSSLPSSPHVLLPDKEEWAGEEKTQYELALLRSQMEENARRAYARQSEPPLAPPTKEEAQVVSFFSSLEAPPVQQQSEDAKGKCKCKMPVQQQSQEVKRVRQCEACGKQEKYLFRCAGCKQVRYCTRTCQKKDWRSHKPYCKKN